MTADKLVNEEDKLIAEGDAHLTLGNFTVTSDVVIYDKAKKIATASEDVTLSHANGRLIAPQAAYALESRQISAPAFRAGTPPLYMQGEALQGTSEKLSARDTIVYYHEPDPWSLNASAGKITYLENGTVLIEDATLRVGKLPIFYIPRYEQDEKETPIHVKIRTGARDNLGFYLQNTIFYNKAHENVEPGLLLDFYSKRGVLVGPAFDYRHDTDIATSRGTLRAGFIEDQGSTSELGKDILGRPIDSSRHFLEWRHLSRIENSLEFTASTSWWSDSEVERDFREEIFRDNQQPDSFLEVTHLGEQSILDVFMRYRPNDFQIIQERIPEISFVHLPYALGETGIYSEVKVSFARLIEKDPSGVVADIRSDRFDYYHGFRKPIKVTDYATVTPVVGGRVTHYEKTRTRRMDYTRLLGEVGFDAEMTARRAWDVDDDFWAVHGLRHLVRPRVQYRYIPEAQRGNADIPQIDRDVFDTLVPPIDLANVLDLDDLHEMNVVRLGIENDLQTQHESYGSRTLASLNFFQDYNFTNRPGANDWSNLHSELVLSPAYWLHLDFYNRLNPETLTSRETVTRLRVTDGDVWSLGLAQQNLQNDIDQYQLDFRYKLNEELTMHPRWRYDMVREEFTEQVYAVRQYLGHAWVLEYALSIQRGDNRSDGLGLSMRVELLGF